MTRILHVLEDELSASVAYQINSLCLGLLDHGIESWICTLTQDATQKRVHRDLAANVLECPRRSSLDISFYRTFARHLQEVAPTVIHVWGTSSVAMRLACKFLRPHAQLLATISSQQDAASYFGEQTALSRLSQNRPCVDRFVFNHECLLPEPNEKSRPCQVIPGTIPSCNISIDGSLQTELGLPDSVRFIGVVDDLQSDRRLKDSIWALDLLRVIRPEFHMLIAGASANESRLRQYAANVHLDECVHFLGPRWPVQNMMSHCSFYWQANADMCWPSELLLAMASGIPVVASDTDVHRSLIADGESGYLVPVGDSAEFARRTNILILNPVQAEQFTDAAHQQVTHTYSLANMVKQYVEAYRASDSSRMSAA